MKLYKNASGPIVEDAGQFYCVAGDFDAILNAPDIARALDEKRSPAARRPQQVLAPIGTQEVWAAGVTYFRSRDARMEESQSAGGGDFYARVYEAPRPELFFKSAGWRVVGAGQNVRIRADSKWNVPEPELALVINSAGRIIGYTIGNDISSRDIEGENPLYLPQAKVYDGSCALGPAIWITPDKPPGETKIQMSIARSRGGGDDDEIAFAGETTVSRIKRDFAELVSYLYRETSFPHGCVLLTGTGIVPPATFTLQAGDRIDITIAPIGTLSNIVEQTESRA